MSFVNQFAALSVSGAESEDELILLKGRRAAKKAQRASKHRGEAALLGQGYPAAVAAATTTDLRPGEAEALPPQPPTSPLPALWAFSDARSEPSVGPASQTGSQVGLDPSPDDCFFTMFFSDEHHLVACDEQGNEVFTFEVESVADACTPAFQEQAREIVASILQSRRLEELQAGSQTASEAGEFGGHLGEHAALGGPLSLADLDPELWEGQPGSSWLEAALGDARHGEEAVSVDDWGAWPPSLAAAAAQVQPKFPPLPPPSAPAPTRQQQRPRRRTVAGASSRERKGGGQLRVINRAAVQPGPFALGPAWDAHSAHRELELSGFTLHDDDIDATLLLYGDKRVRESVLASAARLADRNDCTQAASGPTPEDMRQMMAAVAGVCASGAAAPLHPPTPPQRSLFAAGGDGWAGSGVAAVPPQPQGNASSRLSGRESRLNGSAAAASEAEEDGDVGGRYEGRKSLRKVLDEMKQRGWQGVQNLGHQKFVRKFPELGGWKQVFFMACTPSDWRYIHAVRAGLARMDRIAAAKRTELAQAGLLA